MPSPYPSPLQPGYVKAINRVGAVLQRRGVALPVLSAQQCIDRARRRTGLSDLAGESFRPGLERLCESLNTEAALSQTGRLAAYFNIVDSLCVRLRLVNYRAQRSAVSREVIRQPVIILGLPRTGTTILFELLAQDPAHRSPASWEVARPVPPAQEQSYASDRRIGPVCRMLSIAEKLSPGLRSVHTIGARLPQECVYMMASHFHSEQFGFMYDIPSYREWLLRQDMADTYRWHASFLQHMQVDFRRQRWVLKTPPHLACLDALLAQYPDAALVWTHREPTTAMSSFASLVSTLRGGFSDSVDPVRVGRYEARHYGKILERGMAQRERLDRGNFYDIGFEDLCREPMTAIRGLYAHFDFHLSGEAEARMNAYLAQRPRHLYGRHTYSARDFGLDGATYSALYQPYRERYAALLA